MLHQAYIPHSSSQITIAQVILASTFSGDADPRGSQGFTFPTAQNGSNLAKIADGCANQFGLVSRE